MAEQRNSITYARLSDIAKKNLSQIGSMALHSCYLTALDVAGCVKMPYPSLPMKLSAL